jgi:hypothetical protein
MRFPSFSASYRAKGQAHSMNRLVSFMTLLLAFTALSTSGKESPQPEDPWFVLVPGRFVVVGRNPDNGATYAGTASISTQGERFSLARSIIRRFALPEPVSRPGETSRSTGSV